MKSKTRNLQKSIKKIKGNFVYIKKGMLNQLQLDCVYVNPNEYGGKEIKHLKVIGVNGNLLKGTKEYIIPENIYPGEVGRYMGKRLILLD